MGWFELLCILVVKYIRKGTRPSPIIAESPAILYFQYVSSSDLCNYIVCMSLKYISYTVPECEVHDLDVILLLPAWVSTCISNVYCLSNSTAIVTDLISADIPNVLLIPCDAL